MDLDHTPPHTTDDVRQGESGHGVRYMLLAGTALAVIAFAVVAMIVL